MPSVRKRSEKKEKEKDPEARARDREQCVIMVTKATPCVPVGKGGAWRKVTRLRYNQLNQR